MNRIMGNATGKKTPSWTPLHRENLAATEAWTTLSTRVILVIRLVKRSHPCQLSLTQQELLSLLSHLSFVVRSILLRFHPCAFRVQLCFVSSFTLRCWGDPILELEALERTAHCRPWGENKLIPVVSNLWKSLPPLAEFCSWSLALACLAASLGYYCVNSKDWIPI